MPVPSSSLSHNRILAAAGPDELKLVAPWLEQVVLAPGDTVQEVDEPAEFVIFPHAGVVALVAVFEDGTQIEAAVTGREGALNPLSAMSEMVSRGRAVVQVAGSASRIPGDVLRTLAGRTPCLQQALVRYTADLVYEAMVNAACNALHPVYQRVARWLLLLDARCGGDGFYLTHESLAHLLGIHRPSLTVAAGALQRAGIIRYRRGHIQVLDRQRLAAAACECRTASVSAAIGGEPLL